MENEFVPYEQALDLKELGFDEEVFGYYENQDKNLVINFNNSPLTEEQKKRLGLYITNNRNSILPQWATSAPTFSQAFRWFKEKYNLDPQIKSWTERGNIVWYISTEKIGEPSRFKCYEVSVNSYEEAELECLKKLIEIAKSQK